MMEKRLPLLAAAQSIYACPWAFPAEKARFLALQPFTQ